MRGYAKSLPSVLPFATFFYPTLVKRGFSAVSSKTDIFSYDIVRFFIQVLIIFSYSLGTLKKVSYDLIQEFIAIIFGHSLGTLKKVS